MFSNSVQRLWLGSLLVMAAALFGLAGAASAAARLTIVDGDATVVDGDRTVIAAEGLALGAEAIVRTGSKATLVRIEWPDGTAVDLGPDSHAMVDPAGYPVRGGRPPSVFLMRGWLKCTAMGSGNAPGLLAPLVDVQPFKGTLVLMVAPAETWAFAESGSVPLVERELRPPSTLSLKNGEVYVREGATKGSVAPRPTPAQMQRVPRGFRDSLPLRLAAVQDRNPPARLGPPPSYAELQEWLTGERALRRNFIRRFAQRARDATFRAGLVEHLIKHPEWEPVLFPERFVKPKPATP